MGWVGLTYNGGPFRYYPGLLRTVALAHLLAGFRQMRPALVKVGESMLACCPEVRSSHPFLLHILCICVYVSATAAAPALVVVLAAVVVVSVLELLVVLVMVMVGSSGSRSGGGNSVVLGETNGSSYYRWQLQKQQQKKCSWWWTCGNRCAGSTGRVQQVEEKWLVVAARLIVVASDVVKI